MFLKKLDRDFTEEEIKNYLNPHYKIVCNYLETYIIPEMIAYYIATGYYNTLMYEEDFNINIKSIIDELFNYELKNFYLAKKRIKDILKNKYSLKVIGEKPLKFKKNYRNMI